GNVTLTDVRVEDPLVGLDTTLASLAVGASEVFTESYVVTQADVDAGLVFNRASVTAVAPDGQDLREVDTVTVPPVVLPAISVTKTATPIDLIPVAGDSITYTITVENMGNVTLSDVRVLDPLVGLDTTVPSLAVGERLVFVESYVVTAADITAGQVINTATAEGRSPDGTVVTGSDTVAVPETPGSISGTVYIDINENGVLDSEDIRLPGYTVRLFDANGVLVAETITDADGNYVFTSLTSRRFYSITFVSPDGDTIGQIQNVFVGTGDGLVVENQNQSILIGGTLAITKTAGVSSVRAGDLLNYEIAIRNTGTADVTLDVVDTLPAGFVYREGSAAVDGVAFAPLQSGQVLRFEGVTARAGGVTNISLTTYISSSVPVGTHINRVQMFSAVTGAPIGPEATAAVRVEVDSVFQCSTLIGRVFDDLNHDGYFNAEPKEDRFALTDQTYYGGKGKFWSAPEPSAPKREKGLPGVRLVTPNGIAVTTDEHGRFSLPCAALPRDIGSNFMLRLDDRTLPLGYRVTTENPRVVRLTPGMLTKMNFGAAIFPVARVDLSARAFTATGELRPELKAGLQKLVAQIAAKPSIVRLGYQASPDERDAVGNTRLRSVEREIRRLWSKAGRYALTVERLVERPARHPDGQ
ncbi:SdrD B-like domain-containing protein, partial [Pseudotabrizicola sp.]